MPSAGNPPNRLNADEQNTNHNLQPERETGFPSTHMPAHAHAHALKAHVDTKRQGGARGRVKQEKIRDKASSTWRSTFL